ncbi:type III secretion system needle length determinant, SpaN/EivJ family [Obesumbacterium proteus]|uniref:SpaN/EivJ family type III secretion system needle length determinant n=1 Tax=Obesumbacterium proteus TaxID=82983 RepID=UPI00242D9C60|nr:type III secretion system needle length determinant, SpaN/EivJ family [Obesumbacterium proteus]
MEPMNATSRLPVLPQEQAENNLDSLVRELLSTKQRPHQKERSPQEPADSTWLPVPVLPHPLQQSLSARRQGGDTPVNVSLAHPSRTPNQQQESLIRPADSEKRYSTLAFPQMGKTVIEASPLMNKLAVETAPLMSKATVETAPLASKATSEPPPLVSKATTETTPLASKATSEITPLVSKATAETTPLVSKVTAETTPLVSKATAKTGPLASKATSETALLMSKTAAETSVINTMPPTRVVDGNQLLSTRHQQVPREVSAVSAKADVAEKKSSEEPSMAPHLTPQWMAKTSPRVQGDSTNVTPHRAAVYSQTTEILNTEQSGLTYRFSRWGGDFAVAVQGQTGGTLLLQPSDAYVAHRLSEQWQSGNPQKWQLARDGSEENKQRQQHKREGDET